MILINIDGTKFLVPPTANDNSIELIIKHKSDIVDYIAQANRALKAIKDDVLVAQAEPTPDVIKRLKEETGIIGYPFDLRDVTLYILDQKIAIDLEIDL
ncbi:hypothetical protein VQ643_04305 [Pseudomonas sp. F1_0610]|uniref:hypothetical protein n=1 Tax=Pseudomonas sp. F1_0610 TaxID=3114284 RepID=UPI0039C06043